MKLIETEWITYRNAVVPKDAGETQLTEMRRSFFAGAWAYYCLLMENVGTGADGTPQDMALMQSLDEEMREFKERVLRGEA